MEDILTEAVDEVTGRSSKRWSLLLLAFLAGGVFVCWLAARRRGLMETDEGIAETLEPAASSGPV